MAKKTSPGKDKPKKVEPTKEAAKKDAPKKEAAKKEAPKKETPKKEAAKQEPSRNEPPLVAGSQVCIQIVKRPTNQAAQFTLRRLMAKDPLIVTGLNRQQRQRRRRVRPKRRGGRIWLHKPRKLHLVHGSKGESATIRLTQDVLNDLPSVQRFISITQA